MRPHINIIGIALLRENEVLCVQEMPEESLRLSKPLQKLRIIWNPLDP